MKTLQLSEQKARELYRSGSKELKTVLEESFGEDFFSQDVTERVKTYLDACHELGREPLDEKKLLELGLTEHDIAYQKLAIVTEALNGGQKLNVCDANVKRWYPWFEPNGLLPLSLSAVRLALMRMRMRVAGLAFVIKHANLRHIRQNNLLTFGKTSR